MHDGQPRLALTKPEAATALGISVDSFERHVQPELRVVRRGKLRLFDVRELERWLEENSARALFRLAVCERLLVESLDHPDLLARSVEPSDDLVSAATTETEVTNIVLA